MSNFEEQTRALLSDILQKRMAHATFDDAITDFPLEFINKKSENSPHTFYQLLDHIHRAFKDIVEYIDSPYYKELKFPDDLWIDNTKASSNDWFNLIDNINDYYNRFQELLSDMTVNLTSELKLRPGTSHSILREIFIILDHNSFHVGQLIFMRKQLGIW